jgi:hypothetical protein
LKDNLDKYLKSPGTLALSKALHDLYKSLELDSFKDGEDSHAAHNRSKSEMAGESENESIMMNLRDHIIRTDNQAFEFEAINVAVVEMFDIGNHRAENFYGYVQIKFHQQT